jgi:hypothetical protein
MFLHLTPALGGGRIPGFPGQVPVNAGAAAGVNVRPQRAARGRTTLEARKARRRLGWPGGLPGHGPKSCSPSLPPSRKANRSKSPRSSSRPEAGWPLLNVEEFTSLAVAQAGVEAGGPSTTPTDPTPPSAASPGRLCGHLDQHQPTRLNSTWTTNRAPVTAG